MQFDNKSIKFNGFHPSQFTQNYLKHIIESLQEEAPYDSNINAKFSRHDHLYKGIVSIYSSAGKFLAVASGNRLKDVTHKLMEQIRKQLSRWKTKRVQRKRLKDLKIDF